MIEDNVIKYIDLDESMQNLDVYQKKIILILFQIFETMLSYKIKNQLTFVFLKTLFFLQVISISSTKMPKELIKDDYVIRLLDSIKYVITPHRNITDKNSFTSRFIISIVFCSIIFLCIIYIIIVSFRRKVYFTFPIKLLNILNLILNNYGICPLINIMMIVIHCENNKHKYLEIKCYNGKHLFYLIISFFFLIILLGYSFVLSIYYYEVGTIQDKNNLCRTNCYYETLENILSELCFFSSYILFHHLENKMIYRIIYKGIIFINCIIIAIYFNYNVFYYNHFLNIFLLNGWYFLIWFYFLLIIKEIFELKNIIISLFIGWLIIILFNHIFYHMQIMKCLTESNIFETNSLKNVEMFSFYLLKKAKENSSESKTLINGIINSFEEYLNSSMELNEKYKKFLDNLYLQKKLGGKENPLFSVYNIIFVIYEYFFEKPSIKNNMLLIMSYFLVNNLDNYTYASLLCSQIKVSENKIMYLKYLFMEKNKKYQMHKLLQTGKNESINHVELGSVIVYNNYLDTFKLKIYDAACIQIDYFDCLKNNQTNKNLTPTFMQKGEKILFLRKEILELWDKIMKLNPFCEENKKDYLLYLETIIQDLELAEKEEEKFIKYRNSILSQKNNLYYSLFNIDISSIILVDGHSFRGKIIYVTPNFYFLYNYLQKEIINLYIYDLMPPVIAEFHKELEDESIKYSNLINIFTKKIKMILKGKNNILYNIFSYIKCLPNLSYGLIFILDIDKIPDKSYLIILDKNCQINCLSDSYSLNNGVNIESTTTKLYDLNSSIIGHHIGIIIPDFLTNLEYKENQFFLKKEDIELKGTLFPNLGDLTEYDKTVNNIIKEIKSSGQLINEEQALLNHNNHESTIRSSVRKKKTIIIPNNQIYKEYLFDLSKKFQGRSYNVFYKITKKSFLNHKYYFYKITIDNGLINQGNTLIEALSKVNKNLNETKITILNSKNQILDFKEKVKAIKFNISDEEKKNENEIDKNEKQIINNDNINFEKTNKSNFSSNSSIDNSSFNKLKFEILNKKQPLFIIYMKIILYVFNIASIILIVIDCQKTNEEFSGVDKFLNENLFFNFSKISADCFFITGSNYKFNEYKANYLCDEECQTLYKSLLFLCINPLKKILEHSSNYNEEYQTKLTERYNIILSAYKKNKKIYTNFDTINFLRFFLTGGLYVYFHIDLLHVNAEVNALIENLVFGSYYFITELSYIKGFDDNERRKLAIQKFQTNKLFLIINIIIFVFSVISLAYLIIRLYKEEKHFLQKLIKFQNPKFEQYIKYLENLKKKLRNDNGEDEEDKNQDENNNNNSNESDENKHLGRKESITSNKKKKNEKKKNKKSIKGKLSKLQEQKNEKIKVMSSFFFINNLILAIELGFILFIYMTYYIIINLIYNQKRNNFFDFDDIINNLEGIYKQCFDIYVNIKYEALSYVTYIDNQKKAISLLENGESYVEFEGKNYTDITLLENQNYKINVPNVSFNKIGNILLSIMSDAKTNNNKKIIDQSYSTQIKELYQGNVCKVLYDSESEIFPYCSQFWASIFTQGMEQTFNQLTVNLNSIQSDLINCNNLKKKFLDVIYSESFATLDYFYNYYFMDAYLKTKDLLDELRTDKVNSIYKVFKLTMIIYITISVLLSFILLIFVQNKKIVFCSFFNFVGIIPFQYISDDEDIYRDLLRLEKEIF